MHVCLCVPPRRLTFDYGPSYWAASSVAPSVGTDERYVATSSESCETRQLSRPAATSASGDTHGDEEGDQALPPSPFFPRDIADLTATKDLPDAEARSILLRCLEYYGASRLPCRADEEPRMRVSFGLGPDASSEVVAVSDAPVELLLRAAEMCIRQANGDV